MIVADGNDSYWSVPRVLPIFVSLIVIKKYEVDIKTVIALARRTALNSADKFQMTHGMRNIFCL